MFRAAVRRWVRAWWVLPWLAPVLVWALLRWRWVFISLDPALAEFTVRDLLSPRALFLIAAINLIPLLGLAGLWVHRRLGFWRAEGLAVVAALVVVAGCEWVLRRPAVQSAVLLSANARLLPGDWHLKEPLLLQLELQSVRKPDAREAVALIGSSQVVIGFDAPELAGRLGRPVYRRAIAGMFPLEMALAQDLLLTPRPGAALLYLTPLDPMARFTLQRDWGRMLATPRGLAGLTEALGPSLVRQNARTLVEWAWAARCRLWALRDMARQVLFHLAGPGELPAAEPAVAEAAMPAKLQKDPAYIDASFRALEQVLRRMTAEGVDVLVMQGQVKPSFRARFDDAYWAQAEERLVRLVEASGARYIPLSAYAPDIGPDDWRDSTHVSEAGRRKLTDAAARLLAAP